MAILRRNKGIVVIHLMILLLHKYERQSFNKRKQGKDKEMAWKLHLLYGHLYQSQDNEGNFYSHCRPLQSYREAIANISCELISLTLISRRFQDMKYVYWTIC